MTLGDRVAVMRGGVIQQADTPEELYERPTNLFVAGFIGSPSMNFLIAKLEDGTLHTPLGDVTLPDEHRRKVEKAGGGNRDVVMGIRPENFEDAKLVGDKREHGSTITVTVDVLESLGADKFVYFNLEGERAQTKELEELARDTGAEVGTNQVTARLDAASRAKENEDLEVWFDPRKVAVFDLESGKNLTL